MSNQDEEIKHVHDLIERSDFDRETKKELHQKLREAGTDPNVIIEIRETLAPTARDKAEEITDGDREPEHLGKHTPETLKQEVLALAQINPMFRNSKWTQRADKIKNIIEKQYKENPKFYTGLLNKINAVIQGEL